MSSPPTAVWSAGCLLRYNRRKAAASAREMACAGARTQAQAQAEAREALAAAKQKTRVSQKKVDEIKVNALHCTQILAGLSNVSIKYSP